MLLKLSRKYYVCLQSYDFGHFSSTNFAEKLIVSLTNDRLLSYFEKILVNAFSLQNYGDLFLDGLKKKLCALK